MKKLFVVAVTLLFLLGFASCKSECDCTVETMGIKSTTSHGKMSKSDCKDVEKSANAAGGGLVTTKCVSN